MNPMLGIFLLFLAVVVPAGAALQAFDAGLFERLQAQDKTIVLQFSSESCGVCPQQESVLRALSEEPGRMTPAFLQVAHLPGDKMTERYEAKPSTLVVFKGRREIGRSIALYTEEEMRRFISDVRMRGRGVPEPRPKRVFPPKR